MNVNLIAFMMLGAIGAGLVLYWVPYLLLGRLKWKKLPCKVRFAWEPYTSPDDLEQKWFSIAVMSASDSKEKMVLKVFPLSADNIFSNLAQLEQRIAALLKAHAVARFEAHVHPVFSWVSCIEPVLSDAAQESTYAGFFCGLLVSIVSLVEIVACVW